MVRGVGGVGSVGRAKRPVSLQFNDYYVYMYKYKGVGLRAESRLRPLLNMVMWSATWQKESHPTRPRNKDKLFFFYRTHERY